MNIFDLVIHHGSVRQIQLVLENGIDVNNRNKFSETLLMVCIRDVSDPARRIALLKSVSKFNPDFNLQDRRGQTAFILACIYEQEDTLNFLLQQPSVDVNMSDEDGFTGFMRACDNGSKNIVKVLVDAHVNRQIFLHLDKVNNKGMTALKLAIGKHFSKLFGLVNGVYSHKNYAKPKSCVPESEERELPVKNDRMSNSQNGKLKPKKSLNLSLIKRALKEAYLSDDEEYSENGKEENEISEMVKALKECSTDIRQIYNEREQRDREDINELKKYPKCHKGKSTKSHKGKGARIKDIQLKTQPDADKEKVIEKQISYIKSKQTVTLDVPVTKRKARSSNAFQYHPPPAGIHIEGLKFPPQQAEERKIVLSDTSDYDKKLAVKPRASKDDMMYRRVRGTHMSTSPVTINGRPNQLGIKLPHRKVWTAMEQGELDYHPPPGPPLQLPPVRGGFRAQEQRHGHVKHFDRDMWKIVESYKS